MRAIPHPGVVLVVVDTLRADWTTPYGGPPDATPELARWAGRGALFEQARAQSSWTKVSMASLLTSRWPRSLGIESSTDALGEGALTLAEILGGRGFRCLAVQTNGWLDPSLGFHQGFERYAFPLGAGAVGLEKASLWAHGDRVLREARRLIDAIGPEDPFLLYVHLMDVHEYAAPPGFRRFGGGDEGAYRASIAWVDDVLARLRNALDAAGLLDRSLLVLASDHGETFGENGTHGHARNVLTPVLHVPLVLRFPFPVEPVRVSAQVRNLDLAPTVLDLLGIPAPPGFEGASLVPLLLEPGPAEPRPSFASLRERLYPDAVLQDSVTDGRWTYARNLVGPGDGEAGERLFDRAVDPDENVDLRRLEPERAEALRARLEAHWAPGPSGDEVERDVRIDPAIAQRLRAMGYLQ